MKRPTKLHQRTIGTIALLLIGLYHPPPSFAQDLPQEIITTQPNTWRSATIFTHVIWKDLLFYGGGSGADGGDPRHEIEIGVFHLTGPASGYHDENNPVITRAQFGLSQPGRGITPLSIFDRGDSLFMFCTSRPDDDLNPHIVVISASVSNPYTWGSYQTVVDEAFSGKENNHGASVIIDPDDSTQLLLYFAALTPPEEYRILLAEVPITKVIDPAAYTLLNDYDHAVLQRNSAKNNYPYVRYDVARQEYELWYSGQTIGDNKTRSSFKTVSKRKDSFQPSTEAVVNPSGMSDRNDNVYATGPKVYENHLYYSGRNEQSGNYLSIFHQYLEKQKGKPNFIVIFADDLGYGDLGIYGSRVHHTPRLDEMAAEGVRFTDFYAASSVCTPSRAALLTGSYPRRVDMDVSAEPVGTPGRQVLYPLAKKGLNPKEMTIADVLKATGYATACIGKWHLGDQPEFLPTRQGFDEYFGIPYSNDMDQEDCPLPLMRNEQVIEAPAKQEDLTQRYTAEALAFMEANKERPFFLYLPHTMVHAPLHASEDFRGKSRNGRYGDAVEELDWSTGQILDYLKTNGLAENTLVIFTSDNGASVHYEGSNQPLKGHKATTWEGGLRVPAIFWWPGNVVSGHTTDELATTMDILPTLASLADAPLPGNIIDGHDISPLLRHTQASSPTEAFYYYQSEQLQAVRYKQWKLHLPLDSAYDNAYLGTFKYNRPMALYNLKRDSEEQKDVSKEHPEIVRKILTLAEEARSDLGDLGVKGKHARTAGMIEGSPKCNELRQGNMNGNQNTQSKPRNYE